MKARDGKIKEWNLLAYALQAMFNLKLTNVANAMK